MKYLTPLEAAKALSRSLRTVWTYADKGLLTVHWVDGRRVYLRAEIAALKADMPHRGRPPINGKSVV